ncbi:hypothetical protein CWI75_13320 [Kineobactrum sediminis]|uniref:Polysaccharide biosynthesis protein n=1 Tax=Kineobactrum sediminis TaxID=1905677 RepID=A0A2N5Y005_9GAMM|nr:hypothetical protein CWI75_13320 [Kineobactrum sediminis]
MRNVFRSSLVSGSMVYIIANILSASIPFALLPILTRYLRPEEYGEVAMFQMLLAALVAVAGLSVAGAAGRKYYDKDNSLEELRQFIAACLQILSISTFVLLTLLLIFHESLSRWIGLDVQWLFWGIFVAISLIIIQLRLSQWQVRKKAGQFGAFQVFHGAFVIPPKNNRGFE